MTNKDLAIQDSEQYANEHPEHIQAVMNEEPHPFYQIQDQFIRIAEKVESGNMMVLDAVIEFRKAKAFFESQLDLIKSFEEQYQSQIESEANAYQNEYKGAKFEFRSGGKIFNFKGISEIDTKESELKDLKAVYQAAWENKQKGLLAVTEDGEELQLPTVNYRKSSMIVKLI